MLFTPAGYMMDTDPAVVVPPPTFPAADRYDRTWTASTDLAGAGFSFSRSTTAWDSGYVAYAANVPLIDSSFGLYILEQRTNYFLQARSPATQTISLAAGDYTCWLVGSGSVVVGGSRGTATSANPVTFTLASTTSVSFTPSGTVTYVGVENGDYRTLPILTTTAAVTRNADTCTAARTGLSTGTVAFRCRTPYGRDSSSAANLWVIDDGTNNNRLRFFINSSGNLIHQTTTAGTSVSVTVGATTNDTDLVVVYAWGSTNVVKWTLGGVVGTDAVPTTAVPGGLTTERLGAGSGTSNAYNRYFVRNLLWSTRRTDAECNSIRDNI